jgi:hypothetical protein
MSNFSLAQCRFKISLKIYYLSSMHTFNPSLILLTFSQSLEAIENYKSFYHIPLVCYKPPITTFRKPHTPIFSSLHLI